MKAIIMRWCPWSGKSTRAKNNTDSGRVIASNDTIREMYPNINERDVREKLNIIIEWAAGDWLNLVVDNTNMNIKTLTSLNNKLKLLWYETTIQDMSIWYDNKFDYLEECIKRNKWRKWEVPESVIHEMRMSNYMYNDMTKILMVDIDWTIADWTHRQHFLSGDKKDWSAYFNEMSKDKPIYSVLSLVSAFKMQSKFNRIVLISWRPNTYCSKTIEWLNNHNILYDAILMRQWWDKRPDDIVKLELYNKCLKEQKDLIVWVMDDRKMVKAMRKKQWIFVFDVCQWSDDF